MKRYRYLFSVLCLILFPIYATSLHSPSISLVRAAHSFKLLRKEGDKSSSGSKEYSSSHKDKSSSQDTTAQHSSSSQPRKRQVRLILPRLWARILYTATAINPFLAVFFNDYARMLEPVKQIQTHNRLAAAYETIFFFARLKPRVSFAIGAVLRALQLTTAFQYVFDPLAGVGFGLNIICLFAKSRWPATIVLGWSISKPMWKVLGACPPSGLPVPITVSFKKVESGPDLSRAGYSLGLRS